MGCWLLAAGCSKSDDSGATLKVSSEKLTWTSDVLLQTVQVTCDGKWTAKSDVYWCAPIQSSGEGNGELAIWVSPNLTSEAREGIVSISSGGTTRRISVSQPAFTGSLDDYVYHLPVVFHVLYKDKSDETQYVKEGHMADILTEVNKVYAANKMNIVFELAQYNDKGEKLEEPGVVRHEVNFDDYVPEEFLSSQNEDNRQYAKYEQNLKKYINIYVFRFKQEDEKGTTMGISNLPIVPLSHPLDSLPATDGANDYAYTTSPWGCCINNENIYQWQKENELNPRYIVNTMAHELGHYLGLLHTFSEDECRMDDACSDTHICDYVNYVTYMSAYIREQKDKGVEIFNRYNGCLPIPSNQKLNAYLKEVGDICGINKSLHTHLARKTYATHMNRQGYRVSTISKMLGHSNTSITESTYVMFEDNAVIDEARIISDSI